MTALVPCAGFRLPAMTNLSTRSGGRRPKSAKARNRGRWGSGGAAGAMGIERGVEADWSLTLNTENR